MNVISIDRRTQQVRVSRAALSAAAEDSLAASRSASDAIDRAIGHAFAGNRAGVVHELTRIGFELQERAVALANLTHIAETASVCPDGIHQAGHGRAA